VPPDRDEVRPLGPTRRANLAHRAAAAALSLAAILAFAFSPLLSLVIFGMALAVVLDRRGIFGAGRYRAIMGFIAAPWIGLAGVALALLGSIPERGNFLLAPGLVLVAIAVVLLTWSFAKIWRTRSRGGYAELDG
jgi:hypothetical protein